MFHNNNRINFPNIMCLYGMMIILKNNNKNSYDDSIHSFGVKPMKNILFCTYVII